MTLSDDDAETLQELLRDYLPQLTFEVARTDALELRHVLGKRQDLCERLLDELDGASIRR